MTTIEPRRSVWRRRLHDLTTLVALTLIAAVGAHWAWPATRFSDAFAVTVALVLVTLAIGTAWRIAAAARP